jgi:hypothetical protein
MVITEFRQPGFEKMLPLAVNWQDLRGAARSVE